MRPGGENLRNQILATFSFGGTSDYPGSAFDGDFRFESSKNDKDQAIEEFVDWVITSGAGVASAMFFSQLTLGVDPDGDFDHLMDEFLVFSLDTQETNLAGIKQALSRSQSFYITNSVLTGTAPGELSASFRGLVRRCLDTENPGPLLSERLSEYLN